MKLFKIISSFTLALTMSVNAMANVNTDHLKDKTFGKFTFKGCVIIVDTSMFYEYMNILNTSMKTQKNKVTIINQNQYSEHIKEAHLFTKEYIARQNYCSLMR